MKVLLSFCLLIFLPSISHASPEQIIGEDDRVQVKDNSIGIYQSIGHIASPTSFCTGTVIGPRHVLTNGHCVVEDHKNPPLKLRNPGDLMFYPGRFDKSIPKGTFRGVRILTFQGWINKASAHYDVAVLVVDRDLPVPSVNLEPLDEGVLRNAELFITGYSKDTPLGTLWEGKGNLLRITHSDQKIIHNVDTMPGTSGALIRRKKGTGWVGVGVHAGEYLYFLMPANRGVLFNTTVLRGIRRWVSNY